MKKKYMTPSIDFVSFQYSEQVVAQSSSCSIRYVNTDGYKDGVQTCIDGWIERQYYD